MDTKMKDTQYEEVNLHDLNHLEQRVEEIINFASKEGIEIEKDSKFISISEDEFEEEIKQQKKVNTYNKQRLKLMVEEHYKDILIGIGYTVLIIINLVFIINLIRASVYLDLSIVHFDTAIGQIFSFTIMLAAGTLWVVSTNRIWWNFYNRKFFGIYVILITVLIRVSAFLFMIFYILFIPMVAKLKVTVLLTENLITTIGWLATIGPTLGIMIILSIKLLLAIRQPVIIKEIENFKIKFYVEFKSYSKFDYDVVVVRDLRNGKKVIVRQHDRYIHGCTVGASGTAKTSSVLLPIINQDLNTKARNEDAQKKTIVHFIKKGWAYVEEDFDDADYGSEVLYTKIKPVPGYEKKFEEEVVSKYKSAGITVIAPDPSLTDQVYDLSVKKGFRNVNRIDPVKTDDGKWKDGIKGFDPLYISPRIPEWSRRKEIIKRGTLTADIMQAMFEMSGKSDPYFASVNRIGTLITTIVVCLAHERRFKEKPKLSHVRDIINDFDKIKHYLPDLLDINKENNGIYTPIINIVQTEFLGIGRETFEKHAKGLRIQITNFLMNPDIEAMLCADNTIDMDDMLANGQITVINIELGDLGPVDSPAFGLFVTISMINAVLRRSIKGDEWSRLPHFWTIDEFPLIVNPKMESCFTLFRKFRTAMFVALQTLDQMNKNPFLSYLKGVLLNSCGLHVIFGRTNLDDQKIYSGLSGYIERYVEEKGINETPLVDDNPSYSERTMFKLEQVERVSEDEMHNRDFQEVTVLRVNDGRPEYAIGGRVDFLKSWDMLELPRYTVNWSKLKNTQPYKALGYEEEDTKNIAISDLQGEGTIYINAQGQHLNTGNVTNTANNVISQTDKGSVKGQQITGEDKKINKPFQNAKQNTNSKVEQGTYQLTLSDIKEPINNNNGGKILLGNIDELVNFSIQDKGKNKDKSAQGVQVNADGKFNKATTEVNSNQTEPEIDKASAQAAATFFESDNSNNQDEEEDQYIRDYHNDDSVNDGPNVVEVMDVSKL